MTPLEALQATLAGEHAAIYVLGSLGGRLRAFTDAPARTTADAIRAAYDAHLTRTAALEVLLREQGAEPDAAEPAYELPGPATTVGEIRATALEVEQRCIAHYLQAVAAARDSSREWAYDALTQTAALSLGLGAAPELLPGFDT